MKGVSPWVPKFSQSKFQEIPDSHRKTSRKKRQKNQTRFFHGVSTSPLNPGSFILNCQSIRASNIASGKVNFRFAVSKVLLEKKKEQRIILNKRYISGYLSIKEEVTVLQIPRKERENCWRLSSDAC